MITKPAEPAHADAPVAREEIVELASGQADDQVAEEDAPMSEADQEEEGEGADDHQDHEDNAEHSEIV